MTKQELLRQIPRVDEVVGAAQKQEESAPYASLLKCAREEIEELRQGILEEKINEVLPLSLIAQKVIEKSKEICSYSLRPLINATGVILHTNLGRAPLSLRAAQHIKEVSLNYCNLEYDIEKGIRGSRHSHIESLLCSLTGAECAMVVNNNAAAVFVTLAALCKDKEVIVSRGELVEIGGSFRVPEIMSLSGALLKEVGTTNKTKLNDYKRAIKTQSGALLKVHTSNFKIVGFTEEVALEELSALSKEKEIPLIFDLGSGLMAQEKTFGITEELSVKESVAKGADIVCFSGDKLLGGPQAGIIIGAKKYIEEIKKHPFARVIRIDKLTLAALESTLRIYAEKKEYEEIPSLQALYATQEQLKEKAFVLLNMLAPSQNYKAALVETQGQTGGGSSPNESIPSFAVEITPLSLSAATLEKALRQGETPVIVRIHKDKVLLDTRTIPFSLLGDVARAVELAFY